MLRRFGGARAMYVVHTAGGHEVAEHRHDWPNLTIFVRGGCTERFEGIEAELRGPSAIFQPAGADHVDRIAPGGFESIGILFDPAWLRSACDATSMDRPLHISGGSAGAAAVGLARLWTDDTQPEHLLAAATARLFSLSCASQVRPAPAWLDHVSSALASASPPDTRDLARRLGLHPAWLAHAYRAATGEGLQDTVRRARIERAIALLDDDARPLAMIAHLAGFCDQPHMNRCFRLVLGRTPAAVRRERRANLVPSRPAADVRATGSAPRR